ncbi:MAG: Guanine deaminase [Alphaproteobacteria bacterium MarineAlpha3_Bin2]|jgi:guanine deaminase|nr:MAG: Guanine deaminase [Alphaproteobacteria bacterium MarineAlpha3_Bin2]
MAENLVLKGQTLSFADDPFLVGPEAAVEHYSDGAVWMQDGLIRGVGPAMEILDTATGATVVDYGDYLITAGFVDCHAHYPQLPIIASYGEHLLAWLEKYTFPIERRFNDPGHARAAADLFLDECLRNGITTSSVYATVHSSSVDAFFEAATERNLRMACGKVLMDRNAPEELCDTAESGYEQSKALIGKWHQVDRCVYAITPRFAPTSTPAQLEAAGELWKEHPDALVQTHLSENAKEITWVAELFPEAPDYFGVYEHFGLTGPGAIFGHAIHLTEREQAALRQSGSAIAHCPTSNTFIGSGLFDMAGLREGAQPVIVGLATDVAGGSSMSMFDVMRTAYEISQLRGYSLHPAKAWYLASVGSAKAMQLDDRIGNLAPGFEADVTVIDLVSTPLIEQRMAGADTLWDALFAQMILADDRAIRATYAQGRLVHQI